MTERPKVLPKTPPGKRHRDPGGIARTTADSVAGRRMAQAKGALVVDPDRSELTEDQRQWNEEQARRRAEKKG